MGSQSKLCLHFPKPAYVMGNVNDPPKQPKVSIIDDSQCDAIIGSFHFWWCYPCNLYRIHSSIHQPNNIKLDGYLKKHNVITLIYLSTRHNSIDVVAIIQLGLMKQFCFVPMFMWILRCVWGCDIWIYMLKPEWCEAL